MKPLVITMQVIGVIATLALLSVNILPEWVAAGYICVFAVPSLID